MMLPYSWEKIDENKQIKVNWRKMCVLRIFIQYLKLLHPQQPTQINISNKNNQWWFLNP